MRQYEGRVVQTSLDEEQRSRPARVAQVHRRPAGPCYDRAAMPDRFYITTAIAYANNKPGLHTLYEVIGADALARWHRMRGTTRFLTGTDEHSVNIASGPSRRGDSPRDFVDEKVALFQEAEDALLHQPRPLHPDDRSRPRPLGPGDGPPGLRERRHLPRARTRAGTARTRASATRPTSRRRRAARSARTTRTSRSSG